MLTDQSGGHLVFDSSQSFNNKHPSVTVNVSQSSLSSFGIDNRNPAVVCKGITSSARTTTTSLTTGPGVSTPNPSATSVKQVISELEASLAIKNNQQEQLFQVPLQSTKVAINAPSGQRTIQSFSTHNSNSNSNKNNPRNNNTLVKQPLLDTFHPEEQNSDSSVKTQAEREAPGSLTPSPETKRHLQSNQKRSCQFKSSHCVSLKPSMESDSSCHHLEDDRVGLHHPYCQYNHIFQRKGHVSKHHQINPSKSSAQVPLTISTCPSCGSENVSSESMPSSAETKRSLSFQHLIQERKHHHPELTATSSGECNGLLHRQSSSDAVLLPSSTKILTSTPMNHHKSHHRISNEGVNRSKSFNYNLLMSHEGSSSSCMTCKGCDCDYIPSVPNPRLLTSHQHIRRKPTFATTRDLEYLAHPYHRHERNKKLKLKKRSSKVTSRSKYQVPTIFGGLDHRHQNTYVSLYPEHSDHPLYPPKLPTFLPHLSPIEQHGLCCCSQCSPMDDMRRSNNHLLLNNDHRVRNHHHPHRLQVGRSKSFHMNPLDSKLNNYRFWDIDEWRAAVKRQKIKKKERRALLTVCVVGIIVFIAVSYFGTLLFLRITKYPASSSSSSPFHRGM